MPHFKKVNPEFHRHEALHATNILMDMLHSHLVEHTYSKSNINPKFSELLNNAFQNIAQAYQTCIEENEIQDYIEVEIFATSPTHYPVEKLDLETTIEFVAPKTETITFDDINKLTTPTPSDTSTAEAPNPIDLNGGDFDNFEFNLSTEFEIKPPQEETPTTNPHNVLQFDTPSEIVLETNETAQLFNNDEYKFPDESAKTLNLDLVKDKAKSLIVDGILDFDISPLIEEIGTVRDFYQNHVFHAFFAGEVEVNELAYEAIIDKLELNNFIKTSYIYNDVIISQQLTFTKEEYNTYLDREDNEFFNPISKEPCDKDEALQSIEITYIPTQNLIQFIQECLV